MTDPTVRKEFEYVYACVHPQEPRWSFPKDLSVKSRSKAERMGNSAAVARLISMNVDVCVPHMFCYPGMTTYRSIMEFLNIPFVGCQPDAMALSTHKGQSRGVMQHAGVRVPSGELLTQGENEKVTLSPPFILKPCREDNSMGVVLVTKSEDIKKGLETAFKFDQQVLCEEYIPSGELLTQGENEKEVPDLYTIIKAHKYHILQKQTSLPSTTVINPLIIKRTGVVLVTKSEDIKKGLETAFKFDQQVLCEEYIPLGRELRIGAIEDGEGNICVLPAIEYHLSKEKPIRASTDKLTEDKKGLPTGFAKTVTTCPAKINTKLRAKLVDMVTKAHKALGCRDYSLFDVRVSPSGEPFFLEAGLYCSFSPRSVVVNLCKATGDSSLGYHALFRMLIKRAASRKVDVTKLDTQSLGMMKKQQNKKNDPIETKHAA
eukprot:CAMPEP_0184503104 /NCGR_PEP_ID=MMETSP0113_2-20130426/51689_1 /TAXON_ID=91329 /ORGANISM="Norrisiella sphaerica, Strain BC52" /LENGTH=430 /DNA_ID=CAMNT_0026892529 /DNA_START=201 /DNA_END=1493 /DNA_ORIENTATION=+